MIDKLLTPGQAADILAVKKSTIYVWISRGVDIPFFRPNGTHTVRFSEKNLLAWIERKTLNKKRKNFED